MRPFLPFPANRPKKAREPAHIAAYLIIINIIVFAAGLILHELGHLAAGLLAGCIGVGIEIGNLLNPGVPGLYSTILCPATINLNMPIFLGLSGFLFMVPFAIIFLAFGTLRKRPEKNLSFAVLGISIVLAAMDLLLIVPHNVVVYITLIIGITAICIGEMFLVGDYADYFCHRKRANDTARSVSKH